MPVHFPDIKHNLTAAAKSWDLRDKDIASMEQPA